MHIDFRTGPTDSYVDLVCSECGKACKAEIVLDPIIPVIRGTCESCGTKGEKKINATVKHLKPQPK